MALLAVDGFDFYDSPAEMLTRRGYLQWTKGVDHGSAQPGRIAGQGKSYQMPQKDFFAGEIPIVGTMASNVLVGFVGFALSLSAGCTFQFSAIETNAGQNQFTVTFNGSDTSITGPFARTNNNVFPGGGFFFVEIGWVISKTTGRVIVRVNGATVLNQTGNTAPLTANLWVNQISMGTPNLNDTATIDDLYICDNTVGPGTFPCNNFLGDKRVFTLYPTGAGDRTEWTPLSGTNYSQVAVDGGDASYNSTATVGAEDLFMLGALPSSVSQVLGVQVTGRYRNTDATAHTLTQRIKSGGADAPGVGFLAPYALSTDYVFFSDIFAVDPGTGASWTLPALAPGTIQIGYKLET